MNDKPYNNQYNSPTEEKSNLDNNESLQPFISDFKEDIDNAGRMDTKINKKEYCGFKICSFRQ